MSAETVPALPRGPLRRRTDSRVIAGVCGGIADRLNAPPAFIRLLAFFLATSTEWSYAVYPLLALLIPARGETKPSWDTAIGLARYAVLLGGLFLSQSGSISLFDQPLKGVLAPVLAWYGVAGVGAAVLLTADHRRGRLDAADARKTVLAALPTFGAATLLCVGIATLPGVQWEHSIVIVPVVGVLALLAALHTENARLFLAPALIAVAVVSYLGAAGVRLEGGVGDLRIDGGKDPHGRIVARRALGDVVVDVTRIAKDARAVTVDASVGYGTLHVGIPYGSPVRIDAKVGRGVIDPRLADSHRSLEDQTGLDRHVLGTNVPRHGATRPLITIRARVGLGDVEIERGQ